jgi:hypothetical protein
MHGSRRGWKDDLRSDNHINAYVYYHILSNLLLDGNLVSILTTCTIADIIFQERHTDNPYRYYWYYYWTYSIDIHASVVTSTRSTTQTVFSVTTTDAGAASEYFSEKSKTLFLRPLRPLLLSLWLGAHHSYPRHRQRLQAPARVRTRIPSANQA